jgi:hypothetical protein
VKVEELYVGLNDGIFAEERVKVPVVVPPVDGGITTPDVLPADKKVPFKLGRLNVVVPSPAP